MSLTVAGLTGPTGAGKSTVAEILKNQGAYIIDCDKVAREIVLAGSPVLNLLADSFGSDIIKIDGSLDRRLLASRAFSSAQNTEKLNSITQPNITLNVRNKIKQAYENGYSVVIIDAPILFSSPLKDDCDVIICVTAPLEERIERLLHRDNRTRAEIVKRMSAQPTEEFYIDNSDIIIDNAEGVEAAPQCENLVMKLLQFCKDKPKG